MRLNGFFPINNFVYHRLPREGNSGSFNADADILAIRPPHYLETIFGGDQERILESDDWLNEFNGSWVGLIGEVKGSRATSMHDVEKAFSLERLRVATMRLGLLSTTEEINEAVSTLQKTYQIPTDKSGSTAIIKVLFSALPI